MPAATVVPTPASVLVLAPPETWLVIAVMLLNCAGRLSTNGAFVSVLGPALLITTVNVLPWPTATVVLADTLLTVRFTTGATLKVALPTFELAPTVVVRDPAGIEFVTVPPTELVTTAVTVQNEPGGMTAFTGSVSVPSPALIEGTMLTQLDDAVEPEFTNPAGYTSVKSDVSVADTRACVLVIVIVRSEVPPARMLEGANDLPTTGREGVTVSVSVAEQTPLEATHEGLVLVTLTGGAIVATLTT